MLAQWTCLVAGRTRPEGMVDGQVDVKEKADET